MERVKKIRLCFVCWITLLAIAYFPCIVQAGNSYAIHSASYKSKQQAAVDTVKSYLNNSGVVVTNNTQIIFIRLLPGADNIIGTADDQIEQSYSGGKRGDRIGIQIRHKFDTALPIILTMFNTSSSNQSDLNMGVTCYLEHE